MSLLYWLPMLGTLENQGLSDAQPVNYGATVGTAGKLGKCMQLGTASGEIIIPHQDLLTYSGPFSVSFWVNIISNPVNYSTVFAVTGANASWPQEFICFQRNGANSSYTFVVSNGSSSTQNNLLTDALALNTWYHFTLVQDSNKKMYIYQNGALLRDYSTTIAPNFAQTQHFKIGKSHTSYQGNFLINDFRFYTEALSPREIKEVSKGLVLHYPLNREGFGADNLYTGSRDFSGTWVNQSSWLTDSELYNGFTVKKKSSVWGGLAQDVPCANGDVFTISFYAKVDLGGNILSIHRSSLGNVTTGLTILGGNFKPGTTNWVLPSDDGTSWKYYWATVQITSSDITYLRWRIENSIADKYLYVCGIKLEVGNKATPWIPHKTDELYSKMGLNICNENLLSKSSLNPSNWRHIYPSCTSYTGDGYDNMFEMVTTASYENVFLPVAVTSGQQYTLSVTYQVLDSFSLWQSSRPFSFQVLSAVPTNSDTFNNVIGSILLGNTAMSTPQRGSTTFTPTGDTVWLNIPGSYYKDGSSSYNKRVKFSYFKLEKGATATPWVSATSDLEKFGNTVFDTSGYRYDGIYAKFDETGSFSWRGDSPRYNVACQLNSDGVTNYNRTGAAFIRGTVPITTPNTLTVAFWCYGQLSYGNRYHGLFCTSSNTAASDYQASALNHRDNGFDVNSSDGKTHLRLSLGIIVGEWHHYAITYDGQIARSYRDGVLQDINNFSSATALGSFQYVFLGLSGAGGAYRKSVASYSDLRLYVTALSVEDILELYNTPITLSSNGTLLTQGEYVEV